LKRLEEAIASSRNGAAIYGLYRTQLQRDQALEREVIQRDQRVMQLMDWEQEEQAKIERLQERARELETELRGKVETLEQREAELRRRLDSHEGVVAWLEHVGEERATAAAMALGWGDDGEDDDDVAA
jgi:hypothetical protein